jgi:hypothetical protein
VVAVLFIIGALAAREVARALLEDIERWRAKRRLRRTEARQSQAATELPARNTPLTAPCVPPVHGRRTHVDDGFLQIPEDLRRRALVWMFRDEIVARFRLGSLAAQVEHLERTNGVAPDLTSSHPSPGGKPFEATAPDGASDATKDFWWAYRERGRFGSHSSHDDYSEVTKGKRRSVQVTDPAGTCQRTT